MLYRAICLIISALVIWRGIYPFRLPGWLRYLLSGSVLAVMFNTTLQRKLGLEHLPSGLQLGISLLHSLTILYAGFMLLFEAVYGGIKLLGRWKKIRFQKFFELWYCRAGVLVAAFILTVTGMHYALKMPEVKNYELSLPDLPPELEGLTIAHISDMHADKITNGERIFRIVSEVNKLNPDLIVITGDTVDRRAEIIGDDLKALGMLKARYGVFGVPGNHEYYSGYDKWMDFFNSIGIKMLTNRHELIAENRIALGGVTDLVADFFPEMEKTDVKKAFAGAPDGAMKILLAHQPRVAPRAAGEGVALQLSGHTHGGMFFGMDVFVSVFNNGMISGEYDYNGTKVFISNGTGIWNGFPVRLGHESEIVFLRLKRGKL